MSIRALLSYVTALFVVGASALTAKADSLTLNTDGSGDNYPYTYDLTINYIVVGFNLDHAPLYAPDFTTLLITGLSGVTGIVDVEGRLATEGFRCDFTSGEVDCLANGYVPFPPSPNPLTLRPALVILSTSAPGTVDFSFDDNSRSSGSVIGPAASSGPPSSTPEPSTLVLLGTGVATTLWARRRRVAI
jgi:PEP-CTERM motif